MQLNLEEVDFEREPFHDLSKTEVWDDIFARAHQCDWDLVILSPPSNTFSRARHNRQLSSGPKPLRTKEWPFGFPWGSKTDQILVQQANFFVNLCIELAHVMSEVNKFWLFDHPEDLGRTFTGDWPASVWQWPDMQDLIAQTQATTWVLHQCLFGAASSKPTRFASTLPGTLPFPCVFPQFDQQGHYVGPLKQCPHPSHEPVIGLDGDNWKTSSTASFPPNLCSYVASLAFTAAPSTACTHKGDGSSQELQQSVQEPRPSISGGVKDAPVEGQVDSVVEVSSEEEEVTKSESVQSHCFGQPIICSYRSLCKEFTDGLGLCSPGRWRPEARTFQCSREAQQHASEVCDLVRGFVLEKVRDPRREMFKLALGRHACPPWTLDDMKILREKFAAMLPQPAQALEVPDRQPFFLFALAQSLHILVDPDWEILTQGEECFARGVAIGTDAPLPRTPQVFREREKWRDLDKTLFEAYIQKFREDEKLGMMIPMTLATAQERFGADRVLVAAMGAVLKPDGGIRPLHDGIHGVNVNNRIKILDRVEVPGPAEIMQMVQMTFESSEACFALSADIRHAHRRVLIRERDWGLLGCRASTSAKTVWANTVGTFGISSAAYWWTRLFGLVGRWVLRILGNTWIMQCTYVDDLHLVSIGSEKFLNLWIALCCYEMVGTPFSYHKFKGGLTVDFIGYQLDYRQGRAGISERRGRWVTEWIDRLEKNNWMSSGREIKEFLGRLSFVAQVLLWLRQFLAPLYAWSAVVSNNTVSQTPMLVRITLYFIRKELSNAEFMIRCDEKWSLLPEYFRTDAKCEAHCIVLAGWETHPAKPKQECRWFCLEIRSVDIPELFKEDGSTAWASTAAELLASYAALVAFEHTSQQAPGDLAVSLVGGTDNRSNEAVTKKGSTSKWPLLGIHMQLAHTLLKVSKRLRLRWRPRDENIWADQLTNRDFSGFAFAQRIPLHFQDIPLDLFFELSAQHSQFVVWRQEQKLLKSKERPLEKRRRQEDKSVW